MRKITNPFILNSYQDSRYFCDREKETRALLENIQNDRSTTLTAIRRIGKTGLIMHTLSKLPKSYTGVYLDILPTEDLNDFLNTLCSAVFSQIPENSTPGKKILDFIKSLRPVLTFDPLSGQPQLSFDVKPKESTRYVESILRYLEEYPQKIVLAIDEFQQILKYPEPNVDAWLRSIIQSLNNVNFIFSGSQQHLIADMFSNPSRPFFRSTSLLTIEKIRVDKYLSFIKKHIQAADKNIDDNIIEEILSWADLHTYYVQLICNRIYSTADKTISSKTWKVEADKLLREQEVIFFKYRDLLSKQQWYLLKAIAHEGLVYAPTSKDFIAKYSLGSPATVLRSLEALQKKEMIYYAYNPEGEKYYSVYDVLFRRWMERKE